MNLWISIFICIILSGLLIRLFLALYMRFRWIIISKRFCTKLNLKKLNKPINLYIAICDHFQPFWGHVSQEIAEHRVVTWCKEYPRISRLHTDCRGKHPVHTFFYSEEDYNPLLMDSIYKMQKEGFCDVELLLSHANDSQQNFKRKIEEFRDVLFHHHGLLRKNDHGNIIYGFIHGYWALNNSRPDGKNCGVDHEIPILKETGCYADFTYPSAPDITQPPIVNSIYFAKDTPGKSKAHEYGYPLKKGNWSESELLFIQGPLGLNWKNRYYNILPSIEHGGISYSAKFHPDRVSSWIKTGIHIPQMYNHIFIKLFTHGAIDQTIRYLFNEEGFAQMWSFMENKYNDYDNFRLFYVSAFEMYQLIKNLCYKTPTTLHSHYNDI